MAGGDKLLEFSFFNFFFLKLVKLTIRGKVRISLLILTSLQIYRVAQKTLRIGQLKRKNFDKNIKYKYLFCT